MNQKNGQDAANSQLRDTPVRQTSRPDWTANCARAPVGTNLTWVKSS